MLEKDLLMKGNYIVDHLVGIEEYVGEEKYARDAEQVGDEEFVGVEQSLRNADYVGDDE